jgi:hypothetical protein
MKQRRAPWQALPRLHVLLRRLHSLLQRLHSLLVGKIDRLFGCKPMVPGFFSPSYWSLFQACPCEPRRPFSQHDGTRSPQSLPSGRVTPCISEGPSAAPYPRSPKIAALAPLLTFSSTPSLRLALLRFLAVSSSFRRRILALLLARIMSPRLRADYCNLL